MDTDDKVLDDLIRSIREQHEGRYDQQKALERWIERVPEMRATVARYLLKRADCVRVPLIGEVS